MRPICTGVWKPATYMSRLVMVPSACRRTFITTRAISIVFATASAKSFAGNRLLERTSRNGSRAVVILRLMFQLRPASIDDLATLLHHRREMFREMGFTDAALLDDVTSAAEAYFKKALLDGTYRAWLVETEDGAVAGGGGLLIASWPGFPGEEQSRRA